MTEQNKQVTAAYRRHGAKLSMRPEDAFYLIGSGRGDFDPEFDDGQSLGVAVAGSSVDKVICGEPPKLFLVGGIEITRGDRDEITAERPIDIDGLFDD